VATPALLDLAQQIVHHLLIGLIHLHHAQGFETLHVRESHAGHRVEFATFRFRLAGLEHFA
jgi:hypothetical protein